MCHSLLGETLFSRNSGCCDHGLTALIGVCETLLLKLELLPVFPRVCFHSAMAVSFHAVASDTHVSSQATPESFQVGSPTTPHETAQLTS